MHATTRLGLIAVFTFLFAACSSDEEARVADASTQREIGQGKLVGSSVGGANAWLAIPFAKPPVADLRWRAPRLPEPWSGTFEALSLGSACPQLDFSGDDTGDEDCLTLNVHAPADWSAAEGPLPVMYFIHGGGNSIGSAEVYDGSRLARENRVVVVVVQYRLGVLGWFAHSALRADAAGAEDASGNFATLDLIRGLEWVRSNISVFGGDPQRVTIFGESAGGVNVFSLLLSPRAKGLFHGAISQSGFVTTFEMSQAENAMDDEAEPGLGGSSSEVLIALLMEGDRADDRASAKRVAAEMSADDIREYLRGKSSTELLDVFREDAGGLGGMYFAPFVLRDGSVIADRPPLESLASGQYNRVPVIVGTNRDEHRLFQAFSSPHVTHMASIPLRINDVDRYHRVTDYGSKLWKAGGVDEPAKAMRPNQGASVYGYRFDWDEEADFLWVDVANLIGAGHAVELLFVFGGTDSEMAQDHLLEDVASAELLSQQMRSYWTQFAATGNPGRGRSGDLPLWPAWASADAGKPPEYLVFDSVRDAGIHTETTTYSPGSVIASVASDPRLESDAERCEIYASFVQWSDEMTPEAYEKIDAGICTSFPLPDDMPGR